MDGTDEDRRRLRLLPQVQRVLELPKVTRLLALAPRDAVVDAVRSEIALARAGMLAGGDVPDEPALLEQVEARLRAERPRLRRVLNATGIVLHTNLGRAPLAAEALAAMTEAGRSYASLELDLETGVRAGRAPGVARLLRDLTGAEAGLAVNNCAAAVLLALSGLAAGGEVLVSRGELVEIGGGFRIPDVIRQGGARLVEVGTTNKTRLSDYREAITPQTRALLKVHPSNYRMVGFTEETDMAALAGLARERGLVLVQDLGSGNLQDMERWGRPHEASPLEAVAAGADVVTFSGDKLLGGPQAGLLVGREEAIGRLAGHPLFRALRLDKLLLAALEATLLLHADPATAAGIPAVRMLAQNEAALQARAERLREAIGTGEVVPSVAHAGGGTLPGCDLASRAVVLPGAAPGLLARRLRQGAPAVVGRVAEGKLLLDVFTLADGEVVEVALAVRAALG